MRALAFVALVLCLVLFGTWAFAFLQPYFSHPNVGRYEFGAPEGTELRVRDGRLEVLTPTSYWVAGPLKVYLEVATVTVLFVVSVVGCLRTIRAPRSGG